MKQGLPTRGIETDRDCPECDDGGDVQRVDEVVREPDGLVTEERYHCNDCRHAWTDSAPDGLYRRRERGA